MFYYKDSEWDEVLDVIYNFLKSHSIPELLEILSKAIDLHESAN